MIELNCGPVFVGDFVQYCSKETIEIGKVEKFVCMVSFLHLFLYGVIFIFFQEEQSGVLQTRSD